MEYYVDTDNISLDYSEEREIDNGLSYRLTLYDKYGHFDSEVFLTKEQGDDLIEALRNNKS